MLSTNGTHSTSGMSSLTQESMRYRKDGVTFNEFIEGNGLDWRNFGCITYDGMKSQGYNDLLMKRSNDDFRARTNKAKQKLVLSSDELHSTDTLSMHLHTKMLAVNSLLLQIQENPSGSIVDMSNSVENLLVVESAEQIRRWTMQFIHNNSGLSEDNLPLSLIRKYCRLLAAYYIAYNEGKDIIQADAWIRKHRSHRGHSELMDNRLEQLYYPYGREEEVIDMWLSKD